MFKKMYLPYILLFVILFVSSSYGAPTSVIPCKADDTKCLITATQRFYQKLLVGDKSLGVEPLEPMVLEEIDGTQTILKFKMTDTKATGFDKCQVKDVKHDKAQMSLVIKMSCPHLDIAGTYEMDGKLIVLPVQGKGKYSLAMDVYDSVLTLSYKIVTDDNGKQHLSIKSYQAEAVPIKGVKFNFENMFNGKKELASTVQKFANENWKEVTVQFQGPIISTAFKKLVKNANKFLKAMAMDTVFLN
ncbi:circadian clock-controlled protein daywake-like [Plodia interpunctella]|uniref:circadian clock-controlled protein daywake-like n=1 Tax=Plodia interpunctella TaxID=58824 RepID=UPI0023689624|nr:circadian clock-controlled protein daywake-like [Plodia interpunctella]